MYRRKTVYVRQQAIAVRDAAFTGMTEKQAKDFDQCRERISGLSTILEKLKASDLKPQPTATASNGALASA
jgi:hypothetical protein